MDYPIIVNGQKCRSILLSNIILDTIFQYVIRGYKQQKEDNMTNDKKYFVIEERIYSYPDTHSHYNVMKNKAYSLSEATKMLIAYEQLNDSDTTKYHLQLVDLMMSDNTHEPLVLTDEVQQ
jgi:hypothetical protein|tara:strand:- start:54 stop:416 length:363 start_codon:yes stop_codon:yes gene_type:complete